MHYLSTQHEAAIDPGYAYRRRQSSSYHAPLRHSSVGPHIRHQSPPVPQGHVAYRQPPAHPSSAVYTQPAPPSGPIYEHRRSYYQEAPPVGNAYGYGRPQESYYARPAYGGPAHPVYDNGYGDNIRFHQNVGPDHNAFNRKRRGNLPKEATNMFKAWFQDNKVSPYPTEEQKLEMAQITGLTVSQVRSISLSSPLDDTETALLHVSRCHATTWRRVSGLSASVISVCIASRSFLEVRNANNAQISNWFINARRRAPGKEARDKQAAEASKRPEA